MIDGKGLFLINVRRGVGRCVGYKLNWGLKLIAFYLGIDTSIFISLR